MALKCLDPTVGRGATCKCLKSTAMIGQTDLISVFGISRLMASVTGSCRLGCRYFLG